MAVFFKLNTAHGVCSLCRQSMSKNIMWRFSDLSRPSTKIVVEEPPSAMEKGPWARQTSHDLSTNSDVWICLDGRCSI